MTPNEYRAHPSAPLRRAFFRGRYAAQAGRVLSDNPYRTVRVTVKARRGSWSEAFTAAWATGWHDVMNTGASRAEAAATAVEGEER